MASVHDWVQYLPQIATFTRASNIQVGRTLLHSQTSACHSCLMYPMQVSSRRVCTQLHRIVWEIASSLKPCLVSSSVALVSSGGFAAHSTQFHTIITIYTTKAPLEAHGGLCPRAALSFCNFFRQFSWLACTMKTTLYCVVHSDSLHPNSMCSTACETVRLSHMHAFSLYILVYLASYDTAWHLCTTADVTPAAN